MSIEVTVRDAGKFKRNVCGWDERSKHFYIDLSGSELARFYNHDYCAQIVKEETQEHHTGGQSALVLNKITGTLAGSSPMAIVLDRDDADWRFILSTTSITTSWDSRRIKVLDPYLPAPPPPEAGIAFVTGECILETGQPN